MLRTYSPRSEIIHSILSFWLLTEQLGLVPQNFSHYWGAGAPSILREQQNFKKKIE